MAGKCPVCGAPLEGNACSYCGYREPVQAGAGQSTGGEQPQVVINNQTVVNGGVAFGVSKKDKMVTLLLCIFLGGLGVHRFYVGKIGTGVLYLLTAGIFGIGWIVDIVVIAMGNFTDGFGLPIK